MCNGDLFSFLKYTRTQCGYLGLRIHSLSAKTSAGYRGAGSLVRGPDGFWLFKASRALNKKAGLDATLRDFPIRVGAECGSTFPDQRDRTLEDCEAGDY
jgi:hypothetical protein